MPKRPTAPAKRKATTKRTIARRLGVKIDGVTYYPLPEPGHEPGMVAQAILNPCAGAANGTSCGPGCICKDGQRWYTVGALRELGFTLSN
jgi:hypothetical protein